MLIEARGGLGVDVLNDDTSGLLSGHANGHAKPGRNARVAKAINYSYTEAHLDELVFRVPIDGKMDQCGSVATTGHPVVCSSRRRFRDSYSVIQNHDQRRQDQ